MRLADGDDLVEREEGRLLAAGDPGLALLDGAEGVGVDDHPEAGHLVHLRSSPRGSRVPSLPLEARHAGGAILSSAGTALRLQTRTLTAPCLTALATESTPRVA